MKANALLLIPSIFMAFASSAAPPVGQFDLERTKAVMSRLIEQKMKERGVPSVSIALVRGDSIVWKAAFGYANVRTKTPATTDTIYCTGSTFKSATATALMQLEEQGRFKLDQPVNKYLGDVQVQDRLQAEKPVTFRHILSHWSGLTAGAETKPLWGRELPKSLEKMVSSLYSVRPPETKWEYNNWAYGMAGLLVQKISGEEYEKYMVEHVLAPLGVTTPHPVYPSPEMVELMALPYEPGGASGKPRRGRTGSFRRLPCRRHLPHRRGHGAISGDASERRNVPRQTDLIRSVGEHDAPTPVRGYIRLRLFGSKGPKRPHDHQPRGRHPGPELLYGG